MADEYLRLILLIFGSYIVGSFPTSIIVGRFAKGIDIRDHGSGNAGGTNVFRVLGWKPALVVITFDVFKGWLPAAALAPVLFNSQPIPDLGVLQILCGFAAVLGHTYTIFAGFQGGKGVGTLGGVLLALFSHGISFLPGCCCFNNCPYGICIPGVHFSILRPARLFIGIATLLWDGAGGFILDGV